MAMIKLSPSFKDYIWGGQRLKHEFYKKYDGDILAESWELSSHPDGPSRIAEGGPVGQTLQEYIEENGPAVLGTNCERFEEFPVLIKFIDSKKDLSVQVHPNDEYAREHENQYGKTEMWYIVDCDPGAFLYYGFKHEITKEEYRKHIENDTLDQVLNAVPVHKGDVFFIEAGTVHAINKGIIIAEIQQNSNVTYRVYDYGRLGADGKPRALHIEKAIDVSNLCKPREDYDFGEHLVRCDKFVVDRISLNGETTEGNADKTSFHSLLVVDGEGEICCGDERMAIRKGDSIFLPANSGKYTVSGQLTALLTTIPPKAEYRIGIDLGGTAIKAGVVDQDQNIVGRSEVPTEGDQPWEHVVDNMVHAARLALQDAGLDVKDCVACGVGCPGTIDAKTGDVVYSNNLVWSDVPLAKVMSEKLGLPVKVRNDASCAALGEVVAGAARGCDNAVMLTLGTGVGSGIVIDGKIFEGAGPGGAEMGHTILHKNGELCTCGRRGCLEAYASATALIREAKKAAAAHKDSLMVQMLDGDLDKMNAKIPFDAAKQGDAAAKEVIERYMSDLADGIVDAVNIFRPEMILLGGGISKQNTYLTDPLHEQVAKQVFGGETSYLPEIRCAMLENDAGMIGAANIE